MVFIWRESSKFFVSVKTFVAFPVPLRAYIQLRVPPSCVFILLLNGSIKQCLLFILLDIFFIYTSNVFPFPGLTFGNSLSHPLSPCLYEGIHPPTYPLPSSCPGLPLHWGIEHPQAQGPLLPLMSNMAILCHIWGQVNVVFIAIDKYYFQP